MDGRSSRSPHVDGDGARVTLPVPALSTRHTVQLTAGVMTSGVSRSCALSGRFVHLFPPPTRPAGQYRGDVRSRGRLPTAPRLRITSDDRTPEVTWRDARRRFVRRFGCLTAPLRSTQVSRRGRDIEHEAASRQSSVRRRYPVLPDRMVRCTTSTEDGRACFALNQIDV